MISTWPVMAEFHQPVTEEHVEVWFRSVAALYFESSPVLVRMIGTGARLQEDIIEVAMGGAQCPHGALVSAGVSEVYPAAFLVTYRARCIAGVDNVVATGQTRHALIIGGEVVDIPKELRDEFVARAQAARHYN